MPGGMAVTSVVASGAEGCVMGGRFMTNGQSNQRNESNVLHEHGVQV